MVDALDLGSNVIKRVGSSPIVRTAGRRNLAEYLTIKNQIKYEINYI